VGTVPDSTAAVPPQYAGLLAQSGLPVPHTFGQLQAMLAGLVIPLARSHDWPGIDPDSAFSPALKESAPSLHSKLVPASGPVQVRDIDAEVATHARSLVLSRPTEKITPDETLAAAQNDGQSATADSSHELGPTPEPLPLAYPAGALLAHLVDAPGGAAVAWGETTAADPHDFASADGVKLVPNGTEAPGWTDKVMIERAHPGGPLPPGLQVSARTLAAVAVGLALPNVLILGSGVIRKSRSLRLCNNPRTTSPKRGVAY
jgi:hypothetical protein